MLKSLKPSDRPPAASQSPAVASGISVENIYGIDDRIIKAVTIRAAELTAKYPEKLGLFEAYKNYLYNQGIEMENRFVDVTWLARKL